MIRFPATLSPDKFLADFWQKQPLFMPGAVAASIPSLTRDELGWLATLDDVESRIVFTDRDEGPVRYCAETGPFDVDYLQQLPTHDWTLLVHDVEKHLPELRPLFGLIPFIPDWRIDDLMVSFAAPGGGVGPHKDNYDVFLVQGTGIRDWQVTTDEVAPDPDASNELALLQEFSGDNHRCTEGDILYLPPGVPHWGTASEGCMTYSIGMRAPQLSDLVDELPDEEDVNPFYGDEDLSISEVQPGYISSRARDRADQLAGIKLERTALGRTATLTKDWLRPERVSPEDCDQMLEFLARGGSIEVHGMSRIAWDDAHVYVNGNQHSLAPETSRFMKSLCDRRSVSGPIVAGDLDPKILRWLITSGAFDLTAIS